MRFDRKLRAALETFRANAPTLSEVFRFQPSKFYVNAIAIPLRWSQEVVGQSPDTARNRSPSIPKGKNVVAMPSLSPIETETPRSPPSMKVPITGGCQCGAIRFECTAQPHEIQMFKCHCRDCQQVGGGPYAAVVYVPKRTFRVVRGAIHHHTTQSEIAGLHLRGFCAECGSRLTGGESEQSIGMLVANLDDPSGFKPQFNMWTRDAQPWDHLETDVPAFEKYRPQ